MELFKLVQIVPTPTLPLCLWSCIGALEHCIEREPQQSQTQILRSLANITMFLMQKYLKPDGVIGIDGARWQSDSLEFLSATASVATIQDLRKVSWTSYLH